MEGQLPDVSDYPMGPPGGGADAPGKDDGPDLHEVYSSVADSDPDHTAKLLSLSEKTGRSPQDVFGNEAIAAKVAAAPTRQQFKDIALHHPVVGNFLSDPVNMAIAYDDADNLVAHSHINKGLEEAHGYADAIATGLENSILGLEFRGRMPDIAFPANASFSEKFTGNAVQFAADFPYMAAGGAAGALTGNPFIAFGMSFALPDALRETLRQHYESDDHDSAAGLLKKALTAGTLKAGLKGFGIGILTAGAGKYAAPFGKLAESAAEIGTMTTAGALSEGKVPGAEDLASNALLVGLMHGAGHVGGYALDRTFPQRVADTVRLESTKDAAELLDETSRASKLRARDPQAFTDLMNKGKPVMIPVEAYEKMFQAAGRDSEQVSNDLGVAESHEIARKTGGSVVIPQGAWLSKDMDQYRAKFIDDIKFNQDHFTANEMKDVEAERSEQQKAMADLVKKQGEEADKITAADPAAKEQHESVTADARQRLEARVPVDMQLKDKNKWLDANAKIVADHYIAEGSRRKIDAAQLYASEFPAINGDGAAPSGSLEQSGVLTPEPVYPILSRHGQERASEADGPEETGAAAGVRSSRKGAGRSALSEASVRPEDRHSEPLSGSLPKGFPGPTPEIRQAAEIYARSVGLADRQPAEYVTADPARGKRIADAFEAMKHAPNDPLVKRAYDGLIKQTLDQLGVMDKMGVEYEAIPAGEPSPYKNSADMIADVRSGHLWFFPTTEGFGSDASFNDHPLMAPTEAKDVNGKPMLANDVFRVVHDFFGHAKEGNGFGANGEENAWQSHVRMYTPDAAAAMTTETRGQNSWVNFHPKSEANRSEPGSIYADQKAGLLPEFVNTDGIAEDRSALFQASPNPKGEYIPSLNEIRLNKNSDASTFMHEFAHGALQHMFDFVKSGQASAEYLSHFDGVKDFLKIADDQTALTTEQHEKFARAWERYLRGEDDTTGARKAPTPELQGAFNLFRKWLTKVYRQVKGSPLEGELTPAVRGFFDRMVATDDQIAQAAQESGYRDGEIANIEGVDSKSQEKHRTLQERAREQAENALLREQMDELRDENKLALSKIREGVTAEHFNEVANEPVFRAYALFNPEGAKERFTQQEIWKQANDYLNRKLSPEETAHFDAIAEMSTFVDGDEMAKKLLLTERAPAFEAALKSRVDESMKPYADLKDTERIKDAAMKAIHEHKMTELLALEQEILDGMQHDQEVRSEVAKRRRVSAGIAAAAAKDQAKAYLESRPLKDAAAFRSYITAERNAAARVSKAIAEEDFAAAAEAKGQQMLNHALAAEAMKNKAEIARKGKFLDKFIKRGTDMLGMPFGFATKIDDMLVQHGLMDPRDPAQQATLAKNADVMAKSGSTPADIANATGLVQDASGKWSRETLPQFVARVNDDYYPISLPDSVIGATGEGLKQSGTNMTLAELRDLTEAVKIVNQIGKGFERYLSDFIKGDIKANAKAFKAQVEKNIGTPHGNVPALGELDMNMLEKAVASLASQPDGMISSKVNLLTLCEYLDLLDPDGPAKNNIYRPLQHAWKDERVLRAAKAEELHAIREKHYTKDEIARMSDESFSKWQVQTPDGMKDVRLTKENALVMLLNRGSASNLDRITRGFGVNAEKIQEITDGLSKRDHDFAQDMWDYIDTLWPQASALEMKVNGVEPVKVKAQTVESAHGKYKGGYYPLSYDFSKSADAYKNAEQRNALFKQYSTAAAHTEQGALKERVKSLDRPVRLTFDGLFNHLDDVIHDITHRTAIIDVSRFLNEPDTKNAIVNAIGIDGYKKIGDDLKNVGSSQAEFLTDGEQKVKWFRFATSFATLGYRIAIFPRRLTEDVMNSMREVGFKNTLGYSSDYALNPTVTREFVRGKSVLMSERAINRERDLIEMSREWKGNESKVKQFAFLQDTIADQALSYPVWKSVYDANLKFGEQRAAEIADESIIKTFGSGRELDKVGAQRGGELNKLMSMYYSWHSMMFNRAWLQGKIAGLEYDEGNYGKAMAIIAATTATTWIMPAAIDVFWHEVLHNSPQGQESDEEKHKRRTEKFLEAPFAYFPMGRAAAAYTIPLALGERPHSGYQLSPAESAMETILKTVGTGAAGMFDPDKHYDSKFMEDAARTASIMLQSPQQLNTWVFNFRDALNHEGDLTWRDLVTRRTKK